MKASVIRSRVHIPVGAWKGASALLLTLFSVIFMPHAALARSNSYQYVETAQARVYSVDVAQVDQFVAAIRSDDSMWRKAGVTAQSLRPAAADTSVVASYLVIGANAQWACDGYFNNQSAVTVVQKVGHLTFTRPGNDPIVLEPTITMQPGTWTIVKRIDGNFDTTWHQYGPSSAPGLYGLQIDPHLQAAAFESFSDGLAKFELPLLTKALTQGAGASLTFDLIRTDTDPHVGSYPTILNTNSGAVPYELDVCTKTEDCVVEAHTAPPGVSQVPIGRVCAAGCSVRMCLYSCTAGVNLTVSGIYPFVSIGDGGTQVVRQPR
jgi:hypothetical protein